MALENIERFKVEVLRAVAFLYKNCPSTATIEHSTLLKRSEAADGSITIELPSEQEHGTILWLHKNGFVSGDPP